jgi:hypothetical protein
VNTTTTSAPPLTAQQVRDTYDLGGHALSEAVRMGFLRRRTDGLYNESEVERYVFDTLGAHELEERRSGRRQAARAEQAASLELTALDEAKSARGSYRALRTAVGAGPTSVAPINDALRIAIHEAGHAQAARALGCGVSAIAVRGTRGHVAHDAPSRGSLTDRRYAEAVIVAAGPIAVDLAYGDAYTHKRATTFADQIVLRDGAREQHRVVVTELGDAETDAATLNRLAHEAARHLGLVDARGYARHWLAYVTDDAASLVHSVWPALIKEAHELAPA